MHFNFSGSYSEKEKKLFKSAQVNDVIKISEYLKTPLKNLEKIRYEVFDIREGKQEADPHHSISRASARFKQMTIYRFWEPKDDPHFPHETTHLVAHTWAKPYKWRVKLVTWDSKTIIKTVEMVSTSFFQEGLAIAVDEIVFKRKLLEKGKRKYSGEWCKKYINKIPKLIECINFEGFNSFDNEVVVPFSASLSKYLIISSGLGKYKKMYTSIRETFPSDKNINLIEEIYALRIKELQDNWRLFLKE